MSGEDRTQARRTRGLRRWTTRAGVTLAAVGATLGLGLGAGTASAAPTAAPAPAAAPSATPCAVTAKACMDLSSRQAWLTDGAGHITAGPFAARGGTSDAPTPVGTFEVEKKVAHYHSREFDAPMPNAVFFQPGIAFHEDSTKVASNGCIHLGWTASQDFYDTLQPGDPVQVVS